MDTFELNDKLLQLISDYKYLLKWSNNTTFIDEEIYKWEFVTNCSGKPVREIVDYLIKKDINLYDKKRDAVSWQNILNNNPKEFLNVIEGLKDESKDIHYRLQEYKSGMEEVFKNSSFNSYGKDERTASCFLCVFNPSKYPLYKDIDLYDSFCTYLEVKKEEAGKKFEHFMELLKDFVPYIEKDDDLQTIFKVKTNGLVQSNLLIAQTIIWCVFSKNGKKVLGENRIMENGNSNNYWLCSCSFGPVDNQYKNFVDSETWETRLDPGKQMKQVQDVKSVKNGDVIILKIPTLEKNTTIGAIGIVTDIEPVSEMSGNYFSYTFDVDYVKKDIIISFDKIYDKKIEKCVDEDILKFTKSILGGEEVMTGIDYSPYIKLLEKKKNMILHGAPGTGKTFTAKEIAKQMRAEWELVQFHPSYDYTDFVEGLRPINGEDGNIGFKREDGIFKQFCKRALKNESNMIDNFEESWTELISYLSNPEHEYLEVSNLSGRGTFLVEINEYETGLATRTYPNGVYEKDQWISGKSKFYSKDQLYNIYRGLPGTPQGGHDNYRKAVVQKMKEQFNLKEYVKSVETKKTEKFVFIIDEINRGELSKIFGELFYSIDPGYRGEKEGRVKTQYQNLLQGKGDEFEEGFYIPENVYIIGTMNDIDRSVESMDFAMRRRFVFKNVTAEESAKAMGLSDKCKEYMTRLNNAIIRTDGLNESYCVGGSYFLEDGKSVIDMTDLWDLQLESLLTEYLRGMDDDGKKLEKLKKAFFAEPEVVETEEEEENSSDDE